jgi:hypothetical protein
LHPLLLAHHVCIMLIIVIYAYARRRACEDGTRVQEEYDDPHVPGCDDANIVWEQGKP